MPYGDTIVLTPQTTEVVIGLQPLSGGEPVVEIGVTATGVSVTVAQQPQANQNDSCTPHMIKTHVAMGLLGCGVGAVFGGALGAGIFAPLAAASKTATFVNAANGCTLSSTFYNGATGAMVSILGASTGGLIGGHSPFCVDLY